MDHYDAIRGSRSEIYEMKRIGDHKSEAIQCYVLRPQDARKEEFRFSVDQCDKITYIQLV